MLRSALKWHKLVALTWADSRGAYSSFFVPLIDQSMTHESQKNHKIIHDIAKNSAEGKNLGELYGLIELVSATSNRLYLYFSAYQ